MRGFLFRVVKSVLPTALFLAACGYAFAVLAGKYVADGKDSGEALQNVLAWRLPFTLAAWGGGMVLVFELFRALWGQSPAPKPPAARSAEVDAEQLLQQLLDQADAAEAARRCSILPTVSDDTPAPRGEPSAVPVPIRSTSTPAV